MDHRWNFFLFTFLGKRWTSQRPEDRIGVDHYNTESISIIFLEPLFFFSFAVNGEGTFLSSDLSRTTISTEDDPDAPWTPGTHFRDHIILCVGYRNDNKQVQGRCIHHNHDQKKKYTSDRAGHRDGLR